MPAEGKYRLSGGLTRESVYPIVQGYKSTVAVGVRANVSDPLQFNRASVSALYSPDTALPARERVHLDAEYQRFDWTARASWNAADFYDLVGPTKVSRKGYAVSLGHHKTLVFDEPRRVTLAIEGRLAGNLDQLPEYQNVAVIVDKLFTFTATLASTNVRGSLGRVDMKGQVDGGIPGDRDSTMFTKVRATATGLALPSGTPRSGSKRRGILGAIRGGPFAISTWRFGAFIDQAKRYRSRASPAPRSTSWAAAISLHLGGRSADRFSRVRTPAHA
jgi:hypothetical protein